ncbi:hypothetical protein MIMGU_mgv1a006815mg [Erythranthe guttata]|uniref:Uncharacterized protein n=1 Tax=Erythranthe guttata TaxID=4155 RepID=A0A022RM44_ERYGU|nr:hypothetical protein MIMGU_mgv1a006815mg [Erythranthe guttata]
MDFKGITWAGNIYEKFEAMCLEVEEVMYEDTVKYVENQVQKVGVSVKKFYSEVMQDLVPPSCVDPGKVPAAADVALKTYDDVISKKPKLSLSDNRVSLKKKGDVSDFSNDTYLLPPKVVVENTRSDSCSTKSKKLGACRRPIGIKRISQNSQPPKVTRDRIGETNATKSSETVEDSAAPVSVPDKIICLSAEETTVRQEEKTTDSECASEISSLVNKKEDYMENSATLSLPNEPIGVLAEGVSCSKSSSCLTSNTCDVESVCKQDVTTSYEEDVLDNFDMEVIENEEIVGQRPETFDPVGKSKLEDTCILVEGDNLHFVSQTSHKPENLKPETFDPVEKSKLEETCILVDGDNLHFVSQTSHKHKSYKKKIRDALSSKLRPTKKQHQLLYDYKDLGGKNKTEAIVPAHMVDPDKRKLPAGDSLESDWELL